jgi:tRNA-specific 2-thiouridylase
VSENVKSRVVVGLSGGVDSSTAAALLLERGYDVVGVTLKPWADGCLAGAEASRSRTEAVADARNVCHRLSIPHFLIDETDNFQREVIDYFAAEYRAGRTPNPCVRCNERLKFGALISRARELGADFVATGHYARVEQDAATGRYLLKRGRDPRRDQSYFLFSLRQDQLARALFPLGDLLKTRTRELARDKQLSTAGKEESMEICFVPDNDYRSYLQQTNLAERHRGEIVDLTGRVLGFHDGIEFYTIGQRRGLGVSAPRPLYVVDLQPDRNRVVVGDAEDLNSDMFTVERCNWIPGEQPADRIEAVVKIRYNHPGTPAMITPEEDGGALVELSQPQRAVTPGQACVFYQGDLVLGGGWIARRDWQSAANRSRRNSSGY